MLRVMTIVIKSRASTVAPRHYDVVWPSIYLVRLRLT
jgi:hypothetical protein